MASREVLSEVLRVGSSGSKTRPAPRESMQDVGYGLPRNIYFATLVNKGK